MLGFEVIGSFHDHAGFGGVMLGHPGAVYHLEFTTKRGHVVGRAPTQDHLLVFYVPDEAEWRRVVEAIEACGVRPVPSFNPYWERAGKTYEDADGTPSQALTCSFLARVTPDSRPAPNSGFFNGLLTLKT